ncbi:hypothetical protein [Haloplanus sp. C73]|uniref:hypothetical protein n=1 Tax=Haloplanus sp. C73 TaxID=3421641 RepID=UPI003EBA1FB9
MSTRSLSARLTVDSPLAVADTLLTAGSALGLLTYVVALFAGDVGAATSGVVLGVGCVLATLTVRTARDAVR